MASSQPIMLVTGDFVATGGMDRANLALANHLADSGNAVHLVTHRADSSIKDRPNVTTHLVRRPLHSTLLGGPLLDLAGRRLSRHRNPQYRCLVNGGNCRISAVNWVHYVHHAYVPASKGGALRRLKNLAFHQQALRDEIAALKIADVIVVNSERTKRDVSRHIGIPESRIRTVYYGIDPNEFAPLSRQTRDTRRAELGLDLHRPVLAFVGALGDRRKGFDTLFAAWSRLSAHDDWDAHLVVIGTGAELDGWRSQARIQGLSNSIRFLGFRSDVPQILAACDALVSPTRYEAFGLGVQEALSLGIPAIVSASAGIAERYPNQAAYMLLQDPDSTEELTARLQHWRDHADAYRRDCQAISRSIRQHTWSEMGRQIEQILSQVR